MPNSENFYVRLLKEGKKYVGHQISFDTNFNEKPDENIDKGEETKELPKDVEFYKIHNEFSHSMFGYIDILPIIATFAPLITHGIQQRHIARFLNENCVEKNKTEKCAVFSIPINKYSKFNEILEAQKTSHHVSKQVPKMLTIGVVSSLEYHMVLLMREILKMKPHVIENSEKTITIREVFAAGGPEKFKERAIEKEIENIMRSNIIDQIKWMEKHLNISNPISKDYRRWDELIEIVERRNLFTHANGIVNDRYIDNIVKLKFDGKDEIKIGDELGAGRKYFSNVTDIVSEFGIKLAQVVWRKLFPSSSVEADDVIGDFGFKLIERGQYELALRILTFASVELAGKKDSRRKLVDKINLANCYKLLGNDKECRKLLNDEDWSSMSDDFLICKMAIEGNAEAVASKMAVMVHTENWEGTHYEKWPVFYHVREDELVKAKFKEIYGRELIPQKKMKNTIFSLEDDEVEEKHSENPNPKRLQARPKRSKNPTNITQN